VSGFLLWWGREGSALPGEVAARAARGLAHRGPEGTMTRRADGVLAIHTRFTAAVGAEDDLPLVLDDWIVAGDLRLDDQPRLRAHLRDAGYEPPAGSTDARLLGAALEAWGADAATRIIGDFAFAAFDRRARRLVAARGTAGVKSVFVARTASAIACSNDLDVLAALPGVEVGPDPVWVAEFLQSGAPWSLERTARRGVGRVPARTQWEWDARATEPRRRRIWEYPAPAPRLVAREEEVVDGFHEVLGAAVADRLRVPRATVLLSGGLDSPAIAATARRVRPEVELYALTATREPVVPDEESVWAVHVTRALGLAHEVWRTEDVTLRHCDDPTCRTPEPLDEPELAAWSAEVAQLATHGSLTLYGEDGDALLAPPTLATLLRTRPWTETLGAWRLSRTLTGARPWIGWRETARALRARRSHGAHEAATPAWFSADARAHLRAVAPQEARHPTRARAVDSLSAPLWESVFASLDPSVMGRPHGFALPFLDPRVMAYVFALPPIPWCQRKYLLRRAFRGLLPADVLARPKTTLPGFHENLVARWRAAGGAERAVSGLVSPFVSIPCWRSALRTARDPEVLFAAWRVFELDRWLAQPAPGACDA